MAINSNNEITPRPEEIGLEEELRVLRRELQNTVQALEAERRAAAQRLHESEQRLQQLTDSALADAISTISHELRTPLNTIRLWARMLSSDRLPELDRIEGVRVIDRSAEAQQHLIDDLLDVSRMSSGQLRLNLRLTRLADAVRGAIESVQPCADVHMVRIGSHLSADVGLVRADPERIQQVMWNLISNAVKFTPGGGRIDVQMSRTGNEVIIVVKDTGIGIRADFLPHVFERFRQAEVITTRRHGGLGLGLAIAKQLVELHGGTIKAESAGEDRGATFTVCLPLSRAAGDEEEQPHDFSGLSQGVDNMRILLVEDDAGSRMATGRALELRGAIVDAVANAPTALAAYTQMRPDAMVLDIGLPGEDGYSLIRRFRNTEAAQQLPRVPAIALTAFARTRDREHAFNAGFDEHLAKPVEIDALIATLLRLTRIRN